MKGTGERTAVLNEGNEFTHQGKCKSTDDTHVQCSLLQEWLFSWILALTHFHNSDRLKHLTNFPSEETPSA